jgi:DNA-binding NtrC family response regulator/tetratricopeptide (TPR) repeat protein
MQWIAERFFMAGRQWIDAATGGAVNVVLFPAEREQDLAWSEECARLANLRHPMLNALVDYGIASRALRFEAYACTAPLQFGAAADYGMRLLSHVTQFLSGAGVQLPPARAAAAVKPLVAGRAVGRRPLGITLQRRPALDAVEESLDALGPAGPSIVHVAGSHNAGLRTFSSTVARAARLRGFVPLSPAAIRRFPPLLDVVRDRHVCVLDDVRAEDRRASSVSHLLSVLATRSARRHVVCRFERNDADRPAIRLDQLTIRALMRMVFTDGDDAPDADEINAAARSAEGLPGLFVARLSGTTTVGSRSMLVHETAARFDAYEAAEPPPPITGRVLGAALRARHRAETLAARGRHSASERLLERATRVLQGRQRGCDAAQCALQLGWQLLDRGRTQRAWTAFERAQRLAGTGPLSVDATTGMGVALTDDRRLIEAEAVLRGAVAAADTIHDHQRAAVAAAGLSRCLMWQSRHDEAAAVASSARQRATTTGSVTAILVALARAQLRLGRVTMAVRTAREAQAAAASAGARLCASAELALAEALGTAGDLEGQRAAVGRAVRLARAAHLPLVRVRAALLQERRSPTSIARLRKLRLPALLADRLERAAASSVQVEPVAEIERLLDVAQRAADDASAAAQICAVVTQRTGSATAAIFDQAGRVLAVEGRGWPEPPPIVKQVLAHGASVRADRGREPCESAAPLRYGGEVIGALASRWIAGAEFDLDAAGVVLRAAALSAAPHVRAMLDRPVTPPTSAWADLLGESPAAAVLRDQITRAARAPFAVLVEGESGSGKELVARALHRLSARRDRRFCALNCAALTDDLVESELFGHTRGAFTGAASERAGLFEEADGGTLFLDEIGELSSRAQAKLLRVLQEGEVRRVGENFSRRVDVRVVAATNRRLEEEVAAGRFRGDLRFRLDVVRIAVPPLRERTVDIPLLAAHFWQDASTRVGSRATLSRDALAALARYDWPGNVRELQNVIAWIAVHSPRRGRVGPSALPRHVAQATAVAPATFEAAREEFERRFVRAALAGANGQRSRAAVALGVSRQGLSKMMKRLRIQG